MKAKFLMILMTSLGFNCFAQIKYEKGYFINNNGDSISCLLRNVDWDYTPSQFRYKLSDDAEGQFGTIKQVKEFGILNNFIFKRFSVKMDISSENLGELSTVAESDMVDDTLFLELLVKGKANLYKYTNQKFTRFFYNVDNNDSLVEQLIFKNYLTPQINIAKNEKYKTQLWSTVNCDKLEMQDAEKTEYNKKGLIKYFLKYNSCFQIETRNYQENRSKGKINLSIRPGIYIASVKVTDRATTTKIDFGTKFNPRLGFEVEYVLPVNKNKWSVFAEPNYRSYKSSSVVSTQKFTFNYQSIEVPIGIRHYIYLNEMSKIFVNAAFIYDIEFNSFMKLDPGLSYPVSASGSYAIGLGYNYNNSLCAEVRFGQVKNILSNSKVYDSKYSSVSLIIGYRFLGTSVK